MQVHFSTKHTAPRDRVRFWCDYFAKHAHSITPGEVPDPCAFCAEADGSIAGEFGLLDIPRFRGWTKIELARAAGSDSCRRHDSRRLS
jgi:hypothetical protein